MRLPDFIIGGAPRSGTTWLYWLLDRHPAVHMARPLAPEPKFFLVDALYAKGDKPGALKDASEHRYDCLLVWKLDRFGRSASRILIPCFRRTLR